jgi:hypothetical protein
MSTRKTRILPKSVYAERHHIIPRCLGGTDDADNIVRLLTKEHFIAHLLLARIHSGKDGMRMVHALRRMLTGNQSHRYIPNSRTYQTIRTLSMEKCSGENNPMWGKTGENHPSYGKHEQIYTEEFRKKVGEKSKGRVWTEEQRAKRKAAQIAYWADPENRKKQSVKLKQVERTEEWNKKISEGQKGRIHSPETRAKISQARQRPRGD